MVLWGNAHITEWVCQNIPVYGENTRKTAQMQWKVRDFQRYEIWQKKRIQKRKVRKSVRKSVRNIEHIHITKRA